MIDFRDCAYELELDLADYGFYPKINMKQYDVKSRFIKARLYNDGLDFNTTDKDLSFKIIFKKPDEKVVFKDCTVVVDGQDKYVLIPVDANTLAVAGIITSELVIMQDDEVFSTKFFYINCLPSLHAEKGQIESSNDYEGLLEGLIKVEQILKEFEKLDSIVVLHHVINVNQTTKNISFLNWQDYTSNNDIEVFLSGVKQIEGVDFTIDKTTKTITMIDPKTFKDGDEVLLCMFRRSISAYNETTIPASKVEVTPNILGQTNVQNALIQIVNGLNQMPNPNDFVKKAGDTMTGNLNMGNNKVVGDLQGNSDTTTKLKTARTFEIGLVTFDFDGTQDPAITLDDMGAAPKNHTHTPNNIVQDANNRFVTDAEKADWNNKETVQGSQQKADKALQDANAYTDAKVIDVNNYTDTKFNESKQYTDNKVVEVNNYTDNKFNEGKLYTDTKVADLVNSAPDTLDTLKELADALGNDPNFATTVANQIGQKADKTYVDGQLADKANAIDVTNLQNNKADKTELTNGLATKADLVHTHTSNQVNAMTGYTKPNTTSAISQGDSLNAAIGKLERALDNKQASGNYLPTTGGNITGHINFTTNGVGLQQNGNLFLRNNGTSTVLSSNNSELYLRPGGDTSTTGQVVISTNGNVKATTFTGNLNGNATTATRLQTPRTITIGHTGKQFDGNSDVSWTLNEIITSPIGGNWFRGIPTISPAGVMEIGRYIDFHHTDTGQTDYSTRLQTSGENNNIVNLPANSGTLALTTDNVASATRLQTPRNIALQGDVTGTAPFDGSNNATINATLASVTRTNTTSTQSPNFGATFTAIDSVTSDAKGRITGVNTKTITLPNAGAATDEMVKNTPNNTVKAYITGTTTSTESIGTQVFDTNVFLDVTAGHLTATQFNGNLNGNATTATRLQTPRNINGKPFNGTVDVTITGADINVTGYTKAQNYTPIVANDTVNVALGKLEAGLDSKLDKSTKANLTSNITEHTVNQPTVNEILIGAEVLATDVVMVYLSGVRLHPNKHYNLTIGNAQTAKITPAVGVSFIQNDHFTFEILRAELV